MRNLPSYILPVVLGVLVIAAAGYLFATPSGRSTVGLATGESIQCDPLASGVVVSGEITASNVADCYSIKSLDKYLTLSLDAQTDSYLDADIYSPSAVVTNENTGFNWVTTFGLGVQQIAQSLDITDQDYKIKVWSYGNSDTGKYELTATQVSDPPVSLQSPSPDTGGGPDFGQPATGIGQDSLGLPQVSSPIECVTAKIGDELLGTVSASNSADCYSIPGEVAKSYSLTLTAKSGATLDADVYSPNTEVTTANTGYTWVTTFSSDPALLDPLYFDQAGNFSVKVWSYGGYGTDDYTLKIAESTALLLSSDTSATSATSPAGVTATAAVSETCLPLVYSTPVSGSIDVNNLYDCFVWEGGGGFVKVKITSDEGKTIDADLFGPGKPVTALNSGFAWVFTNEGQPQESLVKLTEGAGTYSIKAWSYGNWSQGNYEITVTEITAPGKPVEVKSTQILNTGKPLPVGTTTVTWKAPQADGGMPVTSYEVTSSPDTGLAMVVPADQNEVVINGLSLGKEFTFTVVASNQIGKGLASDPTEPLVLLDVPSAPPLVSASPGDSTVTIKWEPPALNGGSPVTKYVIDTLPGNTVSELTGESREATVSGLNNGTEYSFVVVAYNKLGKGPEGVSDPVTPIGLPGKPENVTATPGNGNATISWQTPAIDGGSAITGYTVTSSPGNIAVATDGRQSSATLSSLTNGIGYTFSIYASNAAGNGALSDSTGAITPTGPPSAPIKVEAVSGDGEVLVSWGVPLSDGGLPVTEYSIKASPGRETLVIPSSKTEGKVTGLTNGKPYSFIVTAVNGKGTSEASRSSSSVIPVGVPTAPEAIIAKSKDRSVELSWRVPASDGGGAIDRYEITTLPGGKADSVLAINTTAVITGLVNGKNYTFSIKAFNSAGGGPVSSDVEETPSTAPGKPTDVVVSSGDKSADVEWISPASDGGKEIISYIVTASPGNIVSNIRSSLTKTNFKGLTNGTSYSFVIEAVNATGRGEKSEPSLEIVPVGVPNAPFGVTASGGASRKANVSWTPPTNNGGLAVTKYIVLSSPDDFSISVVSSATSTVFDGLENGRQYSFTVTAVNALGSSEKSVASRPVEVVGTPSSPDSVKSVAGDSYAVISWNEPSDTGGRAISAYQLVVLPGNTRIDVRADQTSHTVEQLVNGQTYRVQVAALNEFGVGESESTSGFKPIGAPTSPTQVSVSSGDSTATVLWKSPVSDGGSSIVKYVVTSNPGRTEKTVTDYAYGDTYKAVYPSLSNGTAYTFSVKVINFIGKHADSRPTEEVTPIGPPSAPKIRTVHYKSGNSKVTWLSPENNGGKAISSYVVMVEPGAREISVSARTNEAEFTDLVKGSSYRFKVAAVNEKGTGTYSDLSESLLIADPPGAPGRVSATASDSTITVNWTAPADNGGTSITGYKVEVSPRVAEINTSGRAVSTTVRGLINGVSYSVNVYAENKAGKSLPSGLASEIAPYTVPGKPSGLNVAAGDGSVTVSWTAPSSDGGSSITGYRVSVRPGRTSVDVKSDASSTVFTGLANGQPYTFAVSASNPAGSGASSDSSGSVTPVAPPVKSTVPGSPSSIVAAVEREQVTVTWSAPDSDGGDPLTGYKIVSDPGAKTVVSSADSLTGTFSGLSKGISYSFTAIAINSVGEGAASRSSNSVTIKGVPDAPTSVSASTGDGTATVTWIAPGSNGGSAVTGYTVTVTPGSNQVKIDSARTAEATIERLSNGTEYTFTVSATNEIGDSSESRSSNAVTPSARVTTPGNPTSVTASGGDGKATVTWSVPASDGGSPITGYKVTASPGGATVDVDSGRTTNATITRLTNGTSYIFTVRATNTIGDSGESGPSRSVTPAVSATVPDAPSGVAATAGDSKATVTWNVPVSDGGSRITGYTISVFPGRLTASSVGPDTSAEVRGLANGVEYTFSVAAINDVGTGNLSTESRGVTPQQVVQAPGSPTGVNSLAGDGQVVVSWTAPASDGGSSITSYTVHVTPGSTTVDTSSGRETSATVTRLTNGTTYTFSVIAKNSAGSSTESRSSSATPVASITVPGIPTGVSASSGDSSAIVKWTVPADDGGSPITGYIVNVSPGGTIVTVDSARATSEVVGNLTNGLSYTFTVLAVNAAGNSAESDPTRSVTPLGIPDAPTSVTASAGNDSAMINWAAPSADGGSPVTGYTITASNRGGNQSVGPRETSVLFTGLVNGLSYSFTVVAINDVGDSSLSRASNSVTPSSRSRP